MGFIELKAKQIIILCETKKNKKAAEKLLLRVVKFSKKDLFYFAVFFRVWRQWQGIGYSHQREILS